MSGENMLQNADQSYKSHYYEKALGLYKDAEKTGIKFEDEQLYRYAKLLKEHGESDKALLLANKISQMSRENFDIAVLFFHLKKEAGAGDDELISLLENICKTSYDDEIMFMLATLYARNNSPAKSKRVCKQIRNTFRSGPWLEKATELLEAGGILPEGPSVKTDSISKNATEANAAVPAPKVPVPPPTKPDMPTDHTPQFLREAFDGIIGMNSIKNELKKFYDLARIEKLRSEKLGISSNEDRSYNFILCGNPGTGKTTVARIIGKVLHALNIRENDILVEVDRGKLVGEFIGQTAKLTKEAIDTARGGTLFIDEAYSLYMKDSSNDFGKEAIDTLLKDMEDNRNAYSVIMAGYRRQMDEMLKNANPGFRSRFTYHIDIPDYSDDELIEIAHSIAKKHHYIIEPEGESALRKRIAKERIDETFGNARFIRELINEAEANVASRLARMGSFSEADLSVIKAEDIFIVDEDSDGLDDLTSRLNNLTGLADVKKKVEELKNQILVQKEAERRGLPVRSAASSMHMCFKGNAGTGKTTVARLLGRILGELGVLKRSDVFVECNRSDLVGGYQGQTATKVKDVVRSAMGGVLFIDEAYALHQGSNDTFGQEAIDTLVAEMENHRDALVVILAGYTAEIDKFIQANQGLRSRITSDLFFADYTPSEMTDIFYSMVKSSHLLLDEGLRKRIESIFEEKSSRADFGNGRGVRNVFEAVVMKKDSRMAQMLSSGCDLSDETFVTILEQDFESV